MAVPRWQRWLLPAVVGSEGAQRDPDGGTVLPRSLRDWLVDIALFCIALIAGGWTFSQDHHLVGAPLLAIDGLAAFIACAALWVRRRHPVAVGWLAVAFYAFSDSSGGAALVALFTVAVHCPPRRTQQLTLLSVVAGCGEAAIYNHGGFHAGGAAVWLVLTLVAVAFGLYVRVRRELVLSLQERARRAEDEQQLRAREAQLAERARIAREMHDVLAHRISLLSVHAGALEFNPDASPEEIARAASVIRVSAREAQEELREVIGVLRADGEEGAAEGGAEPPQPTLGDLATLIEESRAAGMEVTLENALESEALPPILGRTIYRVVQEALTNARKHAPGQPVTIGIGGDQAAGVRVEVVNRPRVGHQVAPATEDHAESGMGLVGLAERVTLVGGRLSTEALPDGGFRLAATLPWNERP